jgi:hypothetical protein
MTTPYDLPSIPYADEIAAWTAAVVKARREYRINPFAACGVTDCDRLRTCGRMCKHHAGRNYRGQQ